MRHFDSNDDGRVSRREFVEGLSTKMGEDRRSLIFDLYNLVFQVRSPCATPQSSRSSRPPPPPPQCKTSRQVQQADTSSRYQGRGTARTTYRQVRQAGRLRGEGQLHPHVTNALFFVPLALFAVQAKHKEKTRVRPRPF